MTPREAFLKYAAGAFREEPSREGTATFLSDRNEGLFRQFLDSLSRTDDIESLVDLLAMETPAASRDVRYELWISVLRRVREVLGGDRDAAIAEILVHLMYGEYDEAAMAWEDAHDVYASDPEMLKVGTLVAATNRDAETFRICLDLLRLTQPGDRGLAELSRLLDVEDWRPIQERVRYNPRSNSWFERAAQARSKKK